MAEAYRNHTLQECDSTLAQYVDEIRSGKMTFWQTFSCEKCWMRITVDEPNKLFQFGHCQHCGHFTDLKKYGCNYLLSVQRKPMERKDGR